MGLMREVVDNIRHDWLGTPAVTEGDAKPAEYRMDRERFSPPLGKQLPTNFSGPINRHRDRSWTIREAGGEVNVE